MQTVSLLILLGDVRSNQSSLQKREREGERGERERERLGLFSLFTFQPRPMGVDEEDFFWNRSGRQT